MTRCPMCNNEFTEEYYIPKTLPCGHTCCLKCVAEMFYYRNVFICHICCHPVRTLAEIKMMPVNHMIIAELQQEKLIRNMNNASFYQSSHNSMNMNPDLQRSFDSLPWQFRTPQNNFSSSQNFSFTHDASQMMSSIPSHHDTSHHARHHQTNHPGSSHPIIPTKIGYIEVSSQGLMIEKNRPGFSGICDVISYNNERAVVKENQAMLLLDSMLIENEFERPKKKVLSHHRPNDSVQQNNDRMDYQQQEQQGNPFQIIPQIDEERASPDFGEPFLLKKFKSNGGQVHHRDIGNENDSSISEMGNAVNMTTEIRQSGVDNNIPVN